jgi:hypothetical protein
MRCDSPAFSHVPESFSLAVRDQVPIKTGPAKGRIRDKDLLPSPANLPPTVDSRESLPFTI